VRARFAGGVLSGITWSGGVGRPGVGAVRFLLLVAVPVALLHDDEAGSVVEAPSGCVACEDVQPEAIRSPALDVLEQRSPHTSPLMVGVDIERELLNWVRGLGEELGVRADPTSCRL